MADRVQGGSSPGGEAGQWLWRGLALVLAGAGVAASMALRRRSREPAVLTRDEGALRRACLGFALPVLLRGERVRRFRHAESGTQTLSYRVPAGVYPVDLVYAGYERYLRASGFARSEEWEAYLERVREVRPWRARMAAASEGDDRRRQWLADYRDTAVFVHADGLRAASVCVQTEPLRGRCRTVVVTIRPLPG